MKNKLIVIDGCDCSGKATQAKLLYERLLKEKNNTKLISFPFYNKQYSIFTKEYLNGKYGVNPNDVSCKKASLFYAMDRYGSYMDEWKDYYENNLIICDRYVTSNMIHQACKLDDIKEKNIFLDWLYDLEYNILELPKPDMVIFLDVLPEVSKELNENRLNKINNSNIKDIHEQDLDYLKKSYNNGRFIAEKFNWEIIECCNDGNILPLEEIQKRIYDKIKGIL